MRASKFTCAREFALAKLRAGAPKSFSGRFGRLPMIVVLGGVAVGIGVLFYTQSKAHRDAVAAATAEAKPWELVGDPCPEGFTGPWAKPEFAPKKSLVFNGITFTRRSGHADCSTIAVEGKKDEFVPLCQFNGPILVEVKTDKGVFKFQPDVGRPATVSVVEGQPRCVMAANAF